MHRSAGLAVLGALLTLFSGGCGGDSDGSAAREPNPAAEALAGLLQNESLSIAYAKSVQAADFTAAREQAALDPTADLFALADMYAGAEGVIGLLTRELLPFVGSPFGDVAELNGFDGSQITSAAGTVSMFGEPGTLLVATSQSFDEIAAGLLEGGMKQSGDIVEGSTGIGDPSVFPYIADAGGGLVVLSDNRDVAEAAGTEVDPPQEADEVNAAAMAADGPTAYVMVIAPDNGCVDIVTASQNVDPMSGEIEITGPIPKGNVEIEKAFAAAYNVRGPKASPERVAVVFSAKPDHGFADDAIAFTELLDKGAAIRYGC